MDRPDTRGRAGGEARAVRQMAEELARSAPPAVDWDAVEERLLAARARTPMDPPSRARPLALLTVAIAAAAALVVFRAPTAPRTAEIARAIPVHAGDVFEAHEAAGVIDWPGRFHCVLAPGSRAHVVAVTPPPSAGDVEAVTVALDAGSIDVEVVPQPRPETFAVEIGGTRVAVHGTAFRVAYDEGRALVDVSHGVVAVGRPGETLKNPAWLLTGPDKGLFSLDGARDVTWLPPSSRAPVALPAPPAAPSAAVASAPPRAPAPPASLAGAPQPARIEPETALERIAAAVTACHDRSRRPGQVRVSIESTLAITVGADGALRDAVFDPPLSPALMRCASDAAASLRLAHALPGARFERGVKLGD